MDDQGRSLAPAGRMRPVGPRAEIITPRNNAWPDLGAMSLLVGFCLFWFSDTIANPDLWGHLRFGRDILRTGSIIQADVYSYRSGEEPWINHEWLSEVIFATIYDRSGPGGLIAFKVVLSLVVLGLCHAHLRRRGLGPFRSVLLLVLISVPFRMGLATIRPQMFTYLVFLLELVLIEKTTQGTDTASGHCRSSSWRG